MAKSEKYGQMTFESDFLFGTGEEGSAVRFSRIERILLRKFTQHPKSLLTRDALLNAVSGPGSDAVDRNIDFVINKLRRKLGDSARKPTYIATQYGEGYVWLAERTAQSANTAGAFLVVGPIRGMTHLGPFSGLARTFVDDLRRSLDQQTAKESKVVLDENCPSPEMFVGDKPRFAVELSFVGAVSQLDCAVILKTFATGQIIRVSRLIVAQGAPSEPTRDLKVAETAAGELTAAIWDTLTYRGGAPATPSDEPLAVRMHKAANLLANTMTWQETQRRLKAALEVNPDDHHAKLMLATCLHSKYLTSGPMLLSQNDFRAQDEDEMERLTLSSLPHLQDNPVFMMAAGKLLYFIDRGHRPLAISIVEEAFRSTTAFATSFAIHGQIRMLEGDIEAALALFEQGIEQCQNGSEFKRYLLILKSQALLASDQREALIDVLEALYAQRQGLREGLSIFYTSPTANEIAPEVQCLLERIDETHARAMLTWSNYIAARLFRFEEHRENMLRGPLTLLFNRFGAGVVPDDLRVSVPALVAKLTGGAAHDTEDASRRAKRSRPKGEAAV